MTRHVSAMKVLTCVELSTLLGLLLAAPTLGIPETKMEPYDAAPALAKDKSGATPVEPHVPAGAFAKGLIPEVAGAGLKMAPKAYADAIEPMLDLEITTKSAAADAYAPAAQWLESGNQRQLRKLYNRWKRQHGLVYEGREDGRRFGIFKRTLRAIIAANANEQLTYASGLNEFSALTAEEFTTWFSREQPPQGGNTSGVPRGMAVAKASYGTIGDWSYSAYWSKSADGYVTPVKNQGTCGSCWAYAATAAVESTWMIQKRMKWSQSWGLDLSENFLIGCCKALNGYPNTKGCNGGYTSDALDFMGRYYTIPEYRYPYNDGLCYSTSSVPTSERYQLMSPAYYSMTYFTKEKLMEWVWNYGPVIVWIRGGGDLKGYRGGVHNGSCGTDAAGHFVLVVGYDNRAGKQYWIIKNSYGTGWGSNGYLLLPMWPGEGQCKMNRYAYVPNWLNK